MSVSGSGAHICIGLASGTHTRVSDGQRGPDLQRVPHGARYDPRTLRFEETRHAMDGQLIRREQKEQLDLAVQSVVDSAVVIGLEVSEKLQEKIKVRTQELLLDPQNGFDILRETAQKRLLLELAVESAMARAEENGLEVTPPMIAHAKSVSVPSGSISDVYEAVLEKVELALCAFNLVYAVTLAGYKKEGLRLTLTLQTLGSTFTLPVFMGTTIGELARTIPEERQLRHPPGSTVVVKIIGPKGTVLAPSRTLPEAFDYEIDGEAEEDESDEFYELSVLTGQAWKDMGLNGPTRWKHLREKEFMNMFGMSKASFEKLPSWTQATLKRKHSLF